MRAKVESVVWSTTSSVFVPNATVVVLQSDCFMQTRSLQRRHTPHCFMHGIIVERVSCLVHGLHDLHGVWCVFQGWDVGTLSNTLSGCITQSPRVGPSELGLVLSTLLTLFAWLRSSSVFTAVWCGISFVKTHLLSSPDPIWAMASDGLTHLTSLTRV